MHDSWNWLSSILFQASSTFWIQTVQRLYSNGHKFSSGGDLLPIKTTWECVSPLPVSFRDLMILPCGPFILNCYQFPSPTGILYFYIFTFLIISSEAALETQRPGSLKEKTFTSKDRDTGVYYRFIPNFSLSLSHTHTHTPTHPPTHTHTHTHTHTLSHRETIGSWQLIIKYKANLQDGYRFGHLEDGNHVEQTRRTSFVCLVFVTYDSSFPPRRL